MPGRVTNFTNIVSLLGAFLASSVVLGLLGAGLVMPAVGATGATARAGVHVFDTLPSDFTLTPLSQQSRILASDGTLIRHSIRREPRHRPAGPDRTRHASGPDRDRGQPLLRARRHRPCRRRPRARLQPRRSVSYTHLRAH